MATYERFQILSAARQNLFLPQSPVWVSRCQLSRDLEQDMRLLQVRMVNCSDQPVRQVFLRIVCLGPDRRRLTQLSMVPMPAFQAGPGRIFGDDKPIELPVKGTVFVEAFAQRVRFADGSTWDEPGTEGYLAFPTPEPVRRDDPHFEELASRAISGNVRNDCYYRAQQGLWLCTCGMPNAMRSLRCVRCGASRLWLETHMDPNLLDVPPAPAKAPEPTPPPAPAPSPAPAVTVIPTPIRETPPAPPTIIVQPAPEPAPEPEPSHAGRIVAIVLAVLLFLGLGAFCAWRYLKPYLRYQQALREQAAGNYDRAIVLFQDLGEYRDSPQQIGQTIAQKAVSLMNEGKYQEALELFDSVEGCEAQAADCLYALGVLAYNDKDLNTALDYVTQLQTRFPDYDKTQTLADYCYYSLGSQAAAEAAAETDLMVRIGDYEDAQAYFEQAHDYEDSQDRARACALSIANTYYDMGDYANAIESFSALGEDDSVLDCMYAYADQHADDPDQTTLDYLDALLEQGYAGAEELRDRIYGLEVSFRLGTLAPNGELQPLPAEVSDLSSVCIAYELEQNYAAEPTLILVICTMPDGKTARGLLNSNGLSNSTERWEDLSFPTVCQRAGKVTLRFYDATRGESSEALGEAEFRFAPDEPDAFAENTTPTGSPATGADG